MDILAAREWGFAVAWFEGFTLSEILNSRLAEPLQL
jgi:hypothetical protein